MSQLTHKAIHMYLTTIVTHSYSQAQFRVNELCLNLTWQHRIQTWRLVTETLVPTNCVTALHQSMFIITQM